MKIKDQIITGLKESGDLSVKELVDLLEVSKQAIHIAMNQLFEAGIVEKFGKTPKTIYRLQHGEISTSSEIRTIKNWFKELTSGE